jgi:hypothetical protein
MKFEIEPQINIDAEEAKKATTTEEDDLKWYQEKQAKEKEIKNAEEERSGLVKEFKTAYMSEDADKAFQLFNQIDLITKRKGLQPDDYMAAVKDAFVKVDLMGKGNFDRAIAVAGEMGEPKAYLMEAILTQTADHFQHELQKMEVMPDLPQQYDKLKKILDTLGYAFDEGRKVLNTVDQKKLSPQEVEAQQEKLKEVLRVAEQCLSEIEKTNDAKQMRKTGTDKDTPFTHEDMYSTNLINDYRRFISAYFSMKDTDSAERLLSKMPNSFDKQSATDNLKEIKDDKSMT